MLFSVSTAAMATVALLATVSPSGAISLPWLTEALELEPEEPAKDARSFQPQVEQGVYLNTFSSALLNLLSSLNMVKMTNRYPLQHETYKTPPEGYSMHPEAKIGGVGVVIPSGSVSLGTLYKNITYENVGIGLPAGGLTGGLSLFLAFCALIGAGLAALIAFVIPPLQIANQILAIIAIALLVAYIIEDKHYKPKDYKDYDDDSGVYSIYEYSGNYAPDSYGSSGYASDGHDGYSPPSKGYGAPSKGYDRHAEEDSSSSSYAHDKSDKSGSPYAPSRRHSVKTALDYSQPAEKKTTAAPDGKPDTYTAVYPYTQRKQGDPAPGGKDSEEESNLIASGEERRSMVPPTVLNGIERIATAAIVGLGSIYDENQ